MTEQGIKVAIRVRPLNDREISNGQDKIFKCDANNTIYQITNEGQQPSQVFCYDYVFDDTTKTMDVYSNVGKEIVGSVMKGINGTIFACK